MHRTSRTLSCFCVVLAVLLSFAARASAKPGPWWKQKRDPITKLKRLYVQTELVSGGQPRAVLALPSGDRYAAAAARLQAAIARAGGARLPIVRDAQDAETLLKEHNVIALGNMSTNPFLERLYCQWYCLLDLKYPGKGGYVVRSLHNPYATGHNVILVGGSDDAGVGKAADVLCGLLKRGDPLTLGWTMKIALDPALELPDPGEDGTKIQYARKWRSPSRKLRSGEGHSGGRTMGYNPVNCAGLLYYMTGQQVYLDYFKAWVRPDPKNMPAALLSAPGFDDPSRPLVAVSEYHDHLVECVWDLIEESPALTDEQRLYVTQQLYEHQFYRYVYGKSKDDFVYRTPGDHAGYKLLGVYTGSRYFAKYYPSPRWETRMESVRKSMHSFIEKAHWWDTAYWAGKHLQFVFEFFTFDGYDEFVASGAARNYVNMLKTLRNGEQVDDYNKSMNPVLLNMAAHMLKDPECVWLRDEMDFSSSKLRLGRSFWVPAEQAQAPTTLAQRVMAYPPHKAAGDTGPYAGDRGARYKILTYRSGLSDKDDFLCMDGYYGRGRTAYHVNTLYKLRMFGGEYLLSGYNNDVDVWYNGMTDTTVAYAAALNRTVTAPGIAYIETEVDRMPFSVWQRQVLYLQDAGCFVTDRITASNAGRFTVRASWELGGEGEPDTRRPNAVRAQNGAVVVCAGPLKTTVSGKHVHQTADVELRTGKPFTLGTWLSRAEDGKMPTRLRQLRNGVYLAAGPRPGLVTTTDFAADGVTVRGQYAYLGPERLVLVHAWQLVVGDKQVLRTDDPVSLAWNLATGDATIEADSAARLTVAAQGAAIPAVVQAGVHRFEQVMPTAGLEAALARVLGSLAERPADVQRAETNTEDAGGSRWAPDWQVTAPHGITHLAIARSGRIWAASQDDSGRAILGLTPAGGHAAKIACPEEILSLWAAKSPAQERAFELLAGFHDDDIARAYAADGRELWSFKTEPHKSFRIGTRWKAPWFSNPGYEPGSRYKNRGVHSILVGDFWGTGTEQIVVGRPVALEFHSLDGALITRVPSDLGPPTTLAALTQRGAGPAKNVVIAGKYRNGAGWGTSVVGAGYSVRNALGGKNIVEGYSPMVAWGRCGHGDIMTEDLDGDGVQEIVMTISGHWNELRVYPGDAGRQLRKVKPRWMKYFGPGHGWWVHEKAIRDKFMRALALSDLDGDGRKEVIVGLKIGWVHAYDYAGNLRWSRFLDSGIRSLAGLDRALAVGTADRRLLLLDGRTGKTLRTANLESSVEELAATAEGALIAGTRKGLIAQFPGP